MSADRELLALAAKAAGYDVVWDRAMGCFLHRNPPRFNRITRNIWIPLEDDGDALRLAVKLTVMVDFITKPPQAHMSGHVVAVSSAGSFYEHGFTEAATRRAIVRAAAELGRGVP